VKCKFDGAPTDHATIMITYVFNCTDVISKKKKNAIEKKTPQIDNNYLCKARNATFQENL